MGTFILILFLALILIGAIWGIKKGIEQGKVLKKKSNDLGAKDVLLAFHVEGLGIASDAKCEIFRFDDRIMIDANMHKFEIQLEKLRAAVVKTERELIEKGKSVVGRAVIGTLLVPGLGTIVGGMSGIGTKKKKGALNHYLILNYTDSKGELQAVTFKNNLNFTMQKFCDDINKSITQTDPKVIQL